jgi:hypothetical protein
MREKETRLEHMGLEAKLWVVILTLDMQNYKQNAFYRYLIKIDVRNDAVIINVLYIYNFDENYVK